MSKDSSRLAWLAAALAEKRDKIGALLCQMTGFGVGADLKPAVFRKFLGILDQISEAKEEETHLISRIEDIEAKHRQNRTEHRLRHAPTTKKLEPVTQLDYDTDGLKRPQRGYLWLLAFWYLFMRKEINQKKQGLTVD